MLECCRLTAKYIKYIDLGCPKKQSIKALYENQFSNFLKIWLFVEGPFQIIKYISKYVDINISEYEHLHDCQVCAIIFNTEYFLNILKVNYMNIFTNIILKYNALCKK